MTEPINTPSPIDTFQFLARRSALKLELIGMKRHGESAYSVCKKAYGLKGTKKEVLAQMDAMRNELLSKTA